ncbi:LysR family transcriptional regulator [Xylophilus rhododendri]|uniref:LysR family transcriptional regulator n=1 Tax=Xylophilus rhododendri TaxID=2697032 RepID=A0A857IZZ5_9BURK|nr:LysR family transcriptional regulator [Xylophilus rhododendri]QHI96603.1 LysR family transcriptional regulator [Xylophilus rhododendri]
MKRQGRAGENSDTGTSPLHPAIHFDLVTVRLFIETAETGSVTRAAERILLAPAAASRRLKELEQQFGVPLFQRLPHGMALTDAGRALLAHARSMAHAVSRMRDDALAYREGDLGVVRIAACTSAVLQFLPGDIQRCQARHPGIKIDLQELNSQGVLQAIDRGVADIGIYESTVGAVALPTRAYHRDRLVLVVRDDHALADRAAVSFEDMLDHDVIGLTEGSAISTTLLRLAAKARRDLRMRIRVGSFDSMVAMIRQGIAVGVMPQAVARSIAGGSRFKRIPIEGDWPARQMMLCHMPEASMSRAALAALQVIAP